MSRTKWGDFILKEPIDYEAVSKAYEAENWLWGNAERQQCSVPSAARIKAAIESHSQSARLSGGTGWVSSGGLTSRLVNGKIVVSIHGKLRRHLLPPLPTKTSAVHNDPMTKNLAVDVT